MATEKAVSQNDVDQWTHDQESALLQAIIRWKPVGMHKHFRMINIRDHLLKQGVIHPEDAHTSSAGIWRKLASLYDLAKLDEREDAVTNPGPEGSTHPSAYWRDFELPRDEFEPLMWQRRLAPDGSQSPPVSGGASTPADTDEPRSSPMPGSARGSARPGRPARRGGRLSRLHHEVEHEPSRRRTSKTNSVADDDHGTKDSDGADDHDDAKEDQGQDTESGPESSAGDAADDNEEDSEDHKRANTPRSLRSTPRGRGRRGRRRG